MGSLERSVLDSPILMAQLNGLHEYAPDGCRLKSICRTVSEILHCEE